MALEPATLKTVSLDDKYDLYEGPRLRHRHRRPSCGSC